MRRYRPLFFSMLIMGLGACALVGGPDLYDLKLVSIEIVDFRDREEISWLGTGPRRSEPLVMITFSTATDMMRYSRRYEFNISSRAAICMANDTDNARELQREPGIFDKIGRADPNREDETLKRDESKLMLYNTFVSLKSVKLGGNTEYFAYDLQLDPTDFCVQLRGGNMLGHSFKSNVIVVPKALLSEALSRAGL